MFEFLRSTLNGAADTVRRLEAYEKKIAELITLNNDKNNKFKTIIEEEQKKLAKSEQQRIDILKELKRQAVYIESLKGVIKELKENRNSESNKENIPVNLPQKINCLEKVQMKIPLVPKLDLSRIHTRTENTGLSEEADTNEVVDNVVDYHDEFMAMESIFSKSWRDALAKEKRY